MQMWDRQLNTREQSVNQNESGAKLLCPSGLLNAHAARRQYDKIIILLWNDAGEKESIQYIEKESIN